MTDRDSNRPDVETEQEEDRGTTWALPAIALAVAAIRWASPDRQERVASNDAPLSSGNATIPAPK